MKWLEPKAFVSSSEIHEAFSHTFLLGEQLTKRGFDTFAAVNIFLDPDAYQPASPFEFPDMEKAISRIRKSIKEGELIGIWGDFDVDGQTSTALLVDGLKKAGANVAYHIPVRATESHGVQLVFLKQFLEKGVRLLITCDTGITEFESMEYLASLGLDAIISDHHTPAERLPKALAVINPRLLPSEHAFYPLAGVGTAFQLLRGLHAAENNNKIEREYYDLVAMGTIADLADLTRENRYYAKKGLVVMNENPRCALKAILELAGFRNQLISESHISFTLAPRLNAPGRLADANEMVEFLTSTDEQFITETARRLEELNAQRKMAVDMVFNSAVEMLEKQPELLQYPAIVLAKPNWEGGVVGIAASRIVEQFQKPAILLNITNEIAAGSARSIEGINLIEAIRENSSRLIRFGGHPMAAGMSIKVDDIPLFREGLSNSVASQAAGIDLEAKLEIDAYLPISNLNTSLLDEIDQLAPFGTGNPPPLLVSKNLEIEKESLIGKSRDHRKIIIVDQQGEQAEVIWWNSAGTKIPAGLFDLAFYARRDNYIPTGGIILEWVDFHDAVQEEIEVLPRKTKYQIHDHRLSLDVERILQNLISDKDILLWAEGNKHKIANSVCRVGLTRHKKLAILTPPPSIKVLQQVLSAISPDEIYLFSSFPSEDSLKGFLDALSGMIKYCLNHYNGKTTLDSLAGALGHTIQSILVGLEWWQLHGDIKFTITENEIEISKSHHTASPEIISITERVQALLEETSAFRNYFNRANPALIFLQASI